MEPTFISSQNSNLSMHTSMLSWAWNDRYVALYRVMYKGTDMTGTHYPSGSNCSSTRKSCEDSQEAGKIFGHTTQVQHRHSWMIRVDGAQPVYNKPEVNTNTRPHIISTYYTAHPDGREHAKNRLLILNHSQTKSFPHN